MALQVQQHSAAASPQMVVAIMSGYFRLDAKDALQQRWLKHLLLRAVGNDFAIRHQEYAIDLRNHIGKIMGDEDDSGARLRE